MKQRWRQRSRPAAPQRRADATQAIAAWRAHRCWVCGTAFPSFGFGPPLLPAGETVWACSAACTDAIEDRLRGAETPQARMNALAAMLA